MIYVFTSLVDGFDNLHPPACPPDADVRYFCFTNIPNLPRVYPWEYRPIYNVGSASKNSRVPKILPHRMLPADATYSIYHDGNFQLRQDPHKIIDTLLKDHDWAAYKHPARNCIYEEAEIIMRDCPLVPKNAVQEEISRYRTDGVLAGGGLWANGFLVRRHTPEVAQLNEAWWKLYMAGCGRDQLSFSVVRKEIDFRINTINGNVYASEYVLFRFHAAFKARDDNSDFFPARDLIRGNLSALAQLTGSDGGIKHAEY